MAILISSPNLYGPSWTCTLASPGPTIASHLLCLQIQLTSELYKGLPTPGPDPVAPDAAVEQRVPVLG